MGYNSFHIHGTLYTCTSSLEPIRLISLYVNKKKNIYEHFKNLKEKTMYADDKGLILKILKRYFH